MFDNVSYDVEADVLYLHKGEPSTAVDFDESHEGHGLRFDIEQDQRSHELIADKIASEVQVASPGISGNN